MVQINFGRKEVSCKIVYYGPGMSGKTTNLEVVHRKAPEQNRGDMTSISTDGDRTLFFDYMPLDLGTIAGMHTKFQLYTVPGQVYYNSTRKLVLQGVDGVIFVADSHPDKMQENIESFQNLEENLREYGKELKDLPHVVQFNKRDLPEAMAVESLAKKLNQYQVPVFEAVASTGQGVFPTLKGLAGLVLESINQQKKEMAQPAPQAVSHAPQAVASGSAAAPSQVAGPARPSQFTGNEPPGMAAGGGPAPMEPPAAPASPPPVSQPLHQVMRNHAPAQQTPATRYSRGSHQGSSATRPRPRMRRRQGRQKSNTGFIILFSFLVVAATCGLFLLFMM